MLLKHGADANQPNSSVRPLFVACASAQYDIMGMLLERDADPNLPSSFYDIEYLLPGKFRCHLTEHVCKKNAGSLLPLCAAEFLGLNDYAELLLDNGAKINAVDGTGMSVLHAAVACIGQKLPIPQYVSQSDVVTLLLDRDANVSVRNSDGETPLYVAVINGQIEVAEMLLSRGANPNLEVSGGYRLCKTCEGSHTSFIKMMLHDEYDGDDDEDDHKDEFGNPRPKPGSKVSTLPLGQAAGICSIAIVELLLKYGAAIYMLGNKQCTRLLWACEHFKKYAFSFHRLASAKRVLRCIEILLQAGGDVKAVNTHGQTALGIILSALFHPVTSSIRFLVTANRLIELLVRHGVALNAAARAKRKLNTCIINFHVVSCWSWRLTVDLIKAGVHPDVLFQYCRAMVDYTDDRTITTIQICQAVVLAGYRIKPTG